jgi:hypothetical protein
MKRITSGIIFLIGLCGPLLISCENFLDFLDKAAAVEVEFDYDTFIIERNLWKEAGITDYRYRFYRASLPGGDALETVLVVKNGVVTDHYLPPQGGDVPSDHLLTIDEIYDRILTTYYLPLSGLEKILVEYDKEYHFPVKISYQYLLPEESDGSGEAGVFTKEIVEELSHFKKTAATVKRDIPFDYDAFIEEESRWILSKTMNYRYNFYSSGYIFIDEIISVEKGEFKERVPNSKYGDPEPNDWYLLPYRNGIDRIYAAIEDEYKREADTEITEDSSYYTAIVVEYDSQNHIPLRIKYDLYTPPILAVDGNYEHEIRDFTRY